MGEWRHNSNYLNHGTRRSWVVNFKNFYSVRKKLISYPQRREIRISQTNVQNDLNRRFESDKVQRKKKYGVTSESMEKIDQSELNKFKYSFKLQSYRTKLELHVESLIDIQWMRSRDVEGARKGRDGMDPSAAVWDWVSGSLPLLLRILEVRSSDFDMETAYTSFL